MGILNAENRPGDRLSASVLELDKANRSGSCLSPSLPFAPPNISDFKAGLVTCAFGGGFGGWMAFAFSPIWRSTASVFREPLRSSKTVDVDGEELPTRTFLPLPPREGRLSLVVDVGVRGGKRRNWLISCIFC